MFNTNQKIKNLVLLGLFSAIIVVMTLVPFTGYITYGSILEITTIHVVVIIGSCFLKETGGLVLGSVWGITCLLRAFTNPAWVLFTNPLISVLPRILMGLIAALCFRLLLKTKMNNILACIITAIVGTLANTVLVLSSISIFGGMMTDFSAILEVFKSVFTVVISLNGGLELLLAIVLTPALYKAITKSKKA